MLPVRESGNGRPVAGVRTSRRTQLRPVTRATAPTTVTVRPAAARSSPRQDRRPRPATRARRRTRARAGTGRSATSHFVRKAAPSSGAEEDQPARVPGASGPDRDVCRGRQQEREQRVGVVEPGEDEDDGRRGEDGRRDEGGEPPGDEAHGEREKEDGRQGLEELGKGDAPRVEPEDPDGEGHRPEREGWLVRRRHGGEVGGREEGGPPAHRTGLGDRGVVLVHPAEGGKPPAVEERCAREDEPEEEPVRPGAAPGRISAHAARVVPVPADLLPAGSTPAVEMLRVRCQRAGSTSSTRMPPASLGWMKLTRELEVPRLASG